MHRLALDFYSHLPLVNVINSGTHRWTDTKKASLTLRLRGPNCIEDTGAKKKESKGRRSALSLLCLLHYARDAGIPRWSR